MPARKYYIQSARIVVTSILFLPVTIQKRAGTDSHQCSREESAGERL